MKAFLDFISLFSLLVAVCDAVKTRTFINSNLTMNENQLTLFTNEETVSFFAIGDWGGVGVSIGALAVAKSTPTGFASAGGMGTMGSELNTKFQLGLGDNFYFYGVKDSKDKIFKEVFEETYKADQLVNTPWFHVLGNHDHYGNAQGQIDYTAKSNRWIMPNFNYTVDVMADKAKNKLISIVMIDTIKLCGNTIFNPLTNSDIYSNNTPLFANTTDQALAAMHWVDLENKLKAISATKVPYIIVSGHFPVYSVAEHGSTKCLIKNLVPLLHKYKVSAYLSGHDHNLQHLSYSDRGSTVEYFVVGANALNSYSVDNADTVPSGSLKYQWPKSKDYVNGGFLMVQANAANMTMNFVKSSPKFGLPIPKFGYTTSILYTKTILPRRF